MLTQHVFADVVDMANGAILWESKRQRGIVTSISIYGFSFFSQFPFARARAHDCRRFWRCDVCIGRRPQQAFQHRFNQRHHYRTKWHIFGSRTTIGGHIFRRRRRQSTNFQSTLGNCTGTCCAHRRHPNDYFHNFPLFLLLLFFFTHYQVHVTIDDVNDNSPIFTQKHYRVAVAENAQLNPPAAVLQVNALDADDGIYGDVKYAVVANDNSLFQLDPNSGILYPSQSLKGKQGQYKITVEARDGVGFGPNADRAEIVIDVQSINNYRPVFIMPALSNASVEIQEVSANWRFIADEINN